MKGIRRCRRFLETRNPTAANKASQTIKQQIALLSTSPEIGRPSADMPGERELVIDFGSSGYVARYMYEPSADRVTVLALRHQREAGY